jgi:hypothetical protein
LGTIKVPVKVPCLDPKKAPVRPNSAMPDPDTSDINMKANGAAADIELLNQYADEWENFAKGCYTVKEP